MHFNQPSISRIQESIFFKIIVLSTCIFLLLPFFILSYFDFPSVDDFSFALKTIDLGYWGAQVSTYREWNGRYFASAILTAHPLVIHSFSFYTVMPMVLLSLTIHATYYFTRIAFGLTSRLSSFILSVIISFCFLDQMPTLLQGIFWAPAAITYHLANIMTLYLFTIIIVVTKPEQPSKTLKIIGGLLVLAIVGLNETSMLTLCCLLTGIGFYFYAKERRVEKIIVIYFILAVIGVIVVMVAPGNTIREADSAITDKHSFWFTIKNCFITSSKYTIGWLTIQLWLLGIILFCVGIACCKSVFSIKTLWLRLLFVIVLGYLLLAASYATGFWSIARVSPDRTVNVTYWLFLFIWISIMFHIGLLVARGFPLLQQINLRLILILTVAGFFCSTNSRGNYYNAILDLTSGKAFIYKKECLARVKAMESASVIELNTFTAFPKSLFYFDDVQTDQKNWTNLEFSKYFHSISVYSVYKVSPYSQNFFINYDDASDSKMRNSSAITKEVYFSSPASSLADGFDSYSTIFEKPMKELKNAAGITNITINAWVYSSDSVMNSILVFGVVNPQNDNVMWAGKDLTTTSYTANKWNKENFVITLSQKNSQKEILNWRNKLAVYIWNRGKGKVYIDDLMISIN